jgi:hypothetical protein
MDYEVISIFMTVGFNLILTVLTTQTTNKILKLLFMFMLLFSIPLTFATGLEIIKLNNGDSSLDNLLTILNSGYWLSMVILMTVGSYLMINILTYTLNKLKEKFFPKKVMTDIEDVIV